MKLWIIRGIIILFILFFGVVGYIKVSGDAIEEKNQREYYASTVNALYMTPYRIETFAPNMLPPTNIPTQEATIEVVLRNPTGTVVLTPVPKFTLAPKDWHKVPAPVVNQGNGGQSSSSGSYCSGYAKAVHAANLADWNNEMNLVNAEYQNEMATAATSNDAYSMIQIRNNWAMAQAQINNAIASENNHFKALCP